MRILILAALLALSACNGHFLGGYAEGLNRSKASHVVIHKPLRYYGQPRMDLWGAEDDPWLQENDPWLIE